MTYFISDTHFNHDRKFIYEPRGFKSVQEMNEAIIENWNKTVKGGDVVVVAGDFFLGKDFDFIERTLDRLHGYIFLTIGNHDTDRKLSIYHSCEKILAVESVIHFEHKSSHRTFYVSHYPTLTADLNSNPATAVINLFGHTHSKDMFYEDRPYMYNIACDAHNCTPVSIDQICADIEAEIAKCKSFLV